MVSYFPTEITNMIIKYSMSSMINYLRNKKYDWKRLYYELYGEKDISVKDKIKINSINLANYLFKDHEYFISIMNRINQTRISIEGENYKIKIVEGCVHYIDYDKNEWEIIKFPKMVVEVAGGWEHIIVLLADGKIIGFGKNELGIFDPKFDKFKVNGWKKIEFEEKVISVECGQWHSMVLLKNGKVFRTGNNEDRQIGFGYDNSDTINQWTEISLPLKVKQIACGLRSSMILLEDGSVLMSGVICLDECSDCTINLERRIKLPGKAIQIKLLSQNAMILLENGQLFVAGLNQNGQLGLGDQENRDIFVSTGLPYPGKIVYMDYDNCKSIVVLENGKKYQTNESGLWEAYPNKIISDSKRPIVQPHSYFPTDIMNMIIKYSPKELVNYLKDKEYDWKRLYYEMYKENTIKRIYRYRNKSVKQEKSIKEEYLNALINRINNKYRTRSSGNNHDISIHNGKVYVKGSNWCGQIGLGANNNYKIENGGITKHKWQKISFPKKAVHVACGFTTSIILFEDGKIMGAGYTTTNNLRGAEYIRKFTPLRHTYFSQRFYGIKEKEIKHRIIWIECGNGHSVILLENGEILVSGRNEDKQISFDSTSDGLKYMHGWTKISLSLEAIQIVCGLFFTAILLKNGKVLISGKPYYHEIKTEIIVEHHYDEIRELENVAQIKCGHEHILILLENGKLLAYGSNSNGQLGVRNYEYSNTLILINVNFIGNSEISQIDCGNYSSTIILTNGNRFKTSKSGKWKIF